MIIRTPHCLSCLTALLLFSGVAMAEQSSNESQEEDNVGEASYNVQDCEPAGEANEQQNQSADLDEQCKDDAK